MALDDRPISHRLVLEVVRREGTIARETLVDRTGLSERTVTRALAALEADDKLTRERDPEDLRRVVATYDGNPHL